MSTGSRLAVTVPCVLVLLAGCAQVTINQDTRAWLEKVCTAMQQPERAKAAGLPERGDDARRDEDALVRFYSRIATAYGRAVEDIGALDSPPRQDAAQYRTAVVTEFRSLHKAYADTARAAGRYAEHTNVLLRAQRHLRVISERAARMRAQKVERIDDQKDLDEVRWHARPCRDFEP